MNKERILALADLIEKQPHTSVEAEAGFHMDNWTHDCGTPACIAGWAVSMKRDISRLPTMVDLSGEAGEFLDLEDGVGFALFEPSVPNWREKYEYETDFWAEISPRHAAKVLRNLAETGKVDWSIGGDA